MSTTETPESNHSNTLLGLGSSEGLGAWLPIETAPRDGTPFIVARFVDDDEPEYELGCYDPVMWKKYEPAGEGLFREVVEIIHEWAGINNFSRMTHWAPVPPRPRT